METFAERFLAANGKPIEYKGRLLVSSYVLAVSAGDTITVSFLSAVERPVQGIGIRCESCLVRISTAKGKSFALWADTAPARVTVDVVRAKSGTGKVVLFNQWKDEEYGATMYHLNNAAMQVAESADGSAVLRCSDGWGEPDFGDLLVQVRHDRGAIQDKAIGPARP